MPILSQKKSEHKIGFLKTFLKISPKLALLFEEKYKNISIDTMAIFNKIHIHTGCPKIADAHFIPKKSEWKMGFLSWNFRPRKYQTVRFAKDERGQENRGRSLSRQESFYIHRSLTSKKRKERDNVQKSEHHAKARRDKSLLQDLESGK